MRKFLSVIILFILSILCSCSNDKPVASFTVSKSAGCYPLTVAFNAGGSQDPDGSISSYSWAFGDNQTGSGASVNHTYTLTGIFTATLTVTDDSDANATAETVITVNSIDGQWRGTAVQSGAALAQSSSNITIIITRSSTDSTVIEGTAVWDDLPGAYFIGSGSLDTASNLLESTWFSPGYGSFTINGNYADDCRSFSGFANGYGFSNASFSMVWQSLIPAGMHRVSAVK